MEISVSGGGKRECKGPEMGPCLTYSRNSTEVRITRTKQVGGLVRDKIKEIARA